MFLIIQYIQKAVEDAGIHLHGVCYTSKDDNKIRLDFIDENITQEDADRAYEIAYKVLSDQEIYRQQYEEEEAKKITPEKVQPLVDLLVAKGILTQEEINTL